MGLRIVAGALRGRRIDAPRGKGTRPTADRVRQAVFDILGQRIEGGEVLDLYAGSGALGLEALSRGAERAALVDEDREAVQVCGRNVESLGLGGRAEVIRAEALEGVRLLARRGRRFALAFVDPPYELGPDAALAALPAVLAPGARVIAEHDRRHAAPERCGALERETVRTFGDTAVSFYSLAQEPG
jgi:16S rRNA (guanine(966)-N(2))-methyltransferase RsmD